MLLPFDRLNNILEEAAMGLFYCALVLQPEPVHSLTVARGLHRSAWNPQGNNRQGSNFQRAGKPLESSPRVSHQSRYSRGGAWALKGAPLERGGAGFSQH
jgi:hypothetical protein